MIAPPASLLDQYRQIHADPQTAFPGRSLLPYAHVINTLIRKHGSRSLLDYGCGQGLQYLVDRVQDWWGVTPMLYDPAVPRWSARPAAVERFDGVICTDVLEHIPELELDATLDDVLGFARQWAFVTVCCRPAKRILPNGLNAHCTVMPEDWWRALLDRKAREHAVVLRLEFTP